MEKKTLSLIIIFIIVVLIVAGGTYYLGMRQGKASAYKEGYNKGKQETEQAYKDLMERTAAASALNPVKNLPSTNPFEGVTVNPFEGGYQNPFK